MLVTGASRGIGYAVSAAFAKSGATLVVLSQTDKVYLAAEQLGRDFGLQVDAHRVDMGDYEEVAKVVQAVIQKFGKIDVLVNDAAIMGPAGPLETNDPAEWARVIHVNVVGLLTL